MQRLALALLPLCLASGCASVPQGGNADPATDTVDPISLTLRMGEARRLPDNSQLTYVRLVDDSRCAPNVQCVWEGNAEIELRWQPARGGARDLRLHTSPRSGPQSAQIGERSVTLTGLERGIAPRATLELRRSP
jgi:hypothetical protein